MKAKMLGCSEQKGVYKENNYHNYKIFFAHAERNIIGLCVGESKIRSRDSEEIFGVKPFDFETLKMYIGSDVNISYDKKGDIDSIELIDEPEKAAV